MEDMSQDSGRGPSQRWMEVAVAAAIAAFGAIVMIGSLQAGISWGVEGPLAGFFPFYVGLLIAVSSLYNLYRAYEDVPVGKLFAEWGQLRSVMSVVIPTTVYVLAIPYTGIYVASALLIGLFMRWLGRYSWALTLALSVGVPLIIYITFERWFLVPLPKGPLEDWLGL
jgi:putative tricarboxylic transport membrane protein